MISHKYKCIFIHIPKCAGTSIESAFNHHDAYHGKNRQDHRSIRMLEQPLFTPHLFASKENGLEILRRVYHRFRFPQNPNNIITVTKDQYRRYFKFTFIRNPWGRAFSWYKAVLRSETYRKRYKIDGPISLNSFLRSYVGKNGLRSQIRWIKNFKGSIPIDYIGRFEDLDKDFQEICKIMKMGSISLPHKMKGATTDYREEYDEDSINIIREAYKQEIQLFGYSFEK